MERIVRRIKLILIVFIICRFLKDNSKRIYPYSVSKNVNKNVTVGKNIASGFLVFKEMTYLG